MTHEFKSVRAIVENGYCVSCGLCTAVSQGRSEMVWTRDGQLRPQVDQLTATEEDTILGLCPGINLDGPWAEDLQNPDPVWGDMRTVIKGWSSDPEIRHRSSAGGVMTALNTYALETGLADFVFQVAANGADALASDPVMIRDPNQLLSGSQSRYAPTAPLSAIFDALETGEKFVVSLKPCDIAGVRNLQKLDKRAREQIVFTQAMYCGTTPSRSETEAFFDRRNVDTKDLNHMQWRGDGCPGLTTGTTHDGKTVSGPYDELWTGSWQTQFRCKICPDAIALQADIATGDIWAGGMPAGEAPGENAIVAHTDQGVHVLEDAIAKGYLETAHCTVADIDDAQPHHVALRKTFGIRVAANTEAGRPKPNYTNLNEAEMTGSVPAPDANSIREGTLARVAKGQGDECTEYDVANF